MDEDTPLLVSVDKLILKILESTTDRAPTAPSYFQEVLNLCCHHPLPSTYKWFKDQVELISNGDSKWGDLLNLAILVAAVKQVPCNEETQKNWETLLKNSWLSFTALKALNISSQHLLKFLPVWWKHAEISTRKNDLESLRNELVTIFDTHPNLFRHMGASWPIDLREVTNHFFSKQEQRPFRP